MTENDIIKEMIGVFEKLPKAKQDQLLSSEDNLHSWIKSNLPKSYKGSSPSLFSKISGMFKGGIVVGAAGAACSCSQGLSVGTDEIELVVKIGKAIWDYVKKKGGN